MLTRASGLAVVEFHNRARARTRTQRRGTRFFGVSMFTSLCETFESSRSTSTGWRLSTSTSTMTPVSGIVSKNEGLNEF